MEMISKKVTCIAIFCMVAIAIVSPATEALTCATVVSTLGPCTAYLTLNVALSPKCCGAIKSLVSQAKTTADRQTACNCLKNAANIYTVNYARAAGLPGKCGTSLPYPISPNVDCIKVR